MLSGDRLVAPLLDLDGDLLVELADGAGADAGAPQGLRDVLDPADGDSGQIHLHQRLLNADLPALVPLNDRALEGQLPQPRHLQGHFAGLGVQLPVVVAIPVVEPIRRPLVALRPALLLGFGVQHGVQGLFHGLYDHLVEVVLDQAFVDGDHVSKRLSTALSAVAAVVSVGWSSFMGRETFLRTTRSLKVRKIPDVTGSQDSR